ncbi:MAG: YqcI/YcgG family protein, partial [Mycobacterium sp.]
TLGRTTLQALDYLSTNDPLGARCMERNVEDSTWWFSFGGEKLFVLTFGPCYPITNSRYGFQTSCSYLVFQPIHAFSRHLPDGDVGKSRRSREEIRLRYTNAGRPYDLAITLSPYEAHRYVKPAQAGQPPVTWWRKQADG